MESSLKGYTYEEIYDPEKAAELREKKRKHFRSFDTAAHLRGKTYEEIYGEEKAKELKENVLNNLKKRIIGLHRRRQKNVQYAEKNSEPED